MKICVISYGSISIHKNNRYTNPAITSLLHHLAKQNIISYLAPLAAKEDSVYYDGKPIYTVKISEEIKVVNLYPTYSAGSYRSITHFLRNIIILFKHIIKSDLVYIYLPSYSNLIAALMAMLLRKKNALYIGGDWKSLQEIKKSKIVKFFYSKSFSLFVERIYNQARFVLVTGKQNFEDINKPNRNVFQTIPSVSFKTFHRKPLEMNNCNTSNTSINIFFAGPINEGKGTIYLVKALHLLLKKGLEVNLHLAGSLEKSYKEKIDQEIMENHLSNNITFYGYIADKSYLSELFTKMDFFVIPSLSEGFPRTIYEAMMSGVPVISTDLPSIRGSIDDPELVYSVPPKNPEAIANGVSDLFNNPRRRKTMIEKSYNFVEQKVEKKEHYEQVEELINQYALT